MNLSHKHNNIRHSTRDEGGEGYEDGPADNLEGRGKASKGDRFKRRIVGLPETEAEVMGKFMEF